MSMKQVLCDVLGGSVSNCTRRHTDVAKHLTRSGWQFGRVWCDAPRILWDWKSLRMTPVQVDQIDPLPQPIMF